MATTLSAAPGRDWPGTLRRLSLGILALLLLTVPLVFYTATQDQFELPKQLLLRALSSLALGGLLAALAMEPEARWRRSPLDLPVLLWSLWLGVKTLWSVSPAVSFRGEYENFAGSLTQLNYSLLFFLALQLAARLDQARLLLHSILTAATGAALYALLQACQRDAISWSAASIVADRFFGPLGNPNFLGGLMAMAIALKLALARHDGQAAGPRDPERWGRWAMLAGWLVVYAVSGRLSVLDPTLQRTGASAASQAALGFWLISLAAAPLLAKAGYRRSAYWLGQTADLLAYFQVLANTGTRGAFLGLMLGLGALAMGLLAARSDSGPASKPMLLRVVAATALLLVLLGAAVLGLGGSFRTRTVASLRDPLKALEVSRLQIWVPAVKIWRDFPVGGSGVDTFKTVFPSYSRSRFAKYDGENVSSRMAHCEPLQVLATMGAVGLALWAWLCGTAFVLWWRRLRDAVEAEERAVLLGLGGLLAAYLGQNLVSFGVAGISAPFWACLSLLAGGAAVQPKVLRTPRLGLAPALLLGAAVAGLGLWKVEDNLRADLGYAFAVQAQTQMASLESAQMDELRNATGWAFQKLAGQGAALPTAYAEELEIWREQLTRAEQQLQSRPEAAAALRPLYVKAAGSLLMSLAGLRLEEAVRLCPSEVKYRVYLGLSYEELFRRTRDDRRHLWFKEAANAYDLASALNPRNAYYHGNQARLFSMGAEGGSEAFFAEAEKHYLRAVELAPVTRLFYENLLLLYARFAKVEEAGALLGKVEAADKELAPSLLVVGASTLSQWSRSGLPTWTPAAKAAIAKAALDWSRRGLALEPGNAEYALATAVFAENAGDRGQARRWVDEALRLRPGYPDALQYKTQKRL